MKLDEAIRRIKKAHKEGLDACISFLKETNEDLSLIEHIEFLTQEELRDVSLINSLIFAGLFSEVEQEVDDTIVELMESYERKLAEKICWLNYCEVTKGKKD